MSTDELVMMFNETLEVARSGVYEHEGSPVALRRSDLEHKACRVFPSREVSRLTGGFYPQSAQRSSGPCIVEVSPEDSFVAAQTLTCEVEPSARPPLVLNFANPHTPGGGVRHGARAQEEDLCRRSTLYRSLKSSRARAFYRENRISGTPLFTHAAMLSEHVEVFRDASGQYLESPFEVAVLTMAAPYHPDLNAFQVDRLPLTFRERMLGLLYLAACLGYKRLVLGAWGCGAFGNDPEMVAELFCEALRTFEISDREGHARLLNANEVFERIRFAVLPGPNHDVFERTFADFSFAC